MEKTYINKEEFKKGDIIYFDMPSFCTGEYKAEVYEDEGGVFINKEDNYFESRNNGYRLNKPYWSPEYQ